MNNAEEFQKEKKKKRGLKIYLKKLWLKPFQIQKDTDFKIQEAHRAPNKLNPNRPTPRHVLIKMVRVKRSKWRLFPAAKDFHEWVL